MRSGSRTLTFATPMPASPLHQRHESPRSGDNRGAISRAHGGNLDVNLTIMGGHILLAHWNTPARNGYTRVVDANTGRVRAMTWAEKRRPGDKWGAAGIRRWRRPNGEHPLYLDEGLALCVKYGTVPVLELKSPAFGTGGWAQLLVDTCKRRGVPCFTKTLPNMRGAQAKVAAIRAAGGYIALIYGSGIRGRLRRIAATRRVTNGWPVQPNATW